MEGPERGWPEGESQPGGGESRRWWDAIEWKAWRKTQNPAHRGPGWKRRNPVPGASVEGARGAVLPRAGPVGVPVMFG